MLKMRGLAGLLLLTLVVAAAVACGQDDPTATPVPGATATPTPSEADLFQVEWDQLIADAQAEGEVVMILSAPASRNNREIFEAFGQKFGLTVIQTTGSGTTNVNRVLAERGRYVELGLYGY